MTELNQLYKDLIRIQFEDEIKRGLSTPQFWIGFGFILTGFMIVVSFLLV
jgi:hypothetical protein